MQLNVAVVLILAVVLGLATAQQLPIPPRSIGVSHGDPSAPIHIVEFLDYQCLHCKEAYPIVDQVLSYYGPKKIYYTAHTYPLWLHRQAYTVAQAAKMVALNATNDGVYWSFHKFLFDNQDQFSNAAFYNKTAGDLYQLLSSWTPSYGVSQQQFFKQVDGNVIPAMVNAEMHLGTINQVYQTPTFVVNGFKAENLNENSTFEDWKKFIDALL